MKTLTAPIGTIQVTKTEEGFKVYGRMGAVLRANAAKEVTYSNLNETAQEYARMVKALAKFTA